ncbi:MAG TPA: hypothetical protein PKV56_18355 [Burkholderiaceae bacterium]|nr:hypothetical protein [Burkholderiaceae bacterium]
MPYDDRLFALLRELDDQELRTIWVDALKCAPDRDDFAIGSRELKILNISKEWRAVHGHTLLNLRRGNHELPWRRILVDVADKLKPGWGWSDFRTDDERSDGEIEAAILRYFDERAQEAWAKMNEEERAKLASSLEQELAQAQANVGASVRGAGISGITTSSLGAGIGAGLLSGAGALSLAQGATSFALSGLIGGTLYQLSFWIVVRVFGAWSGVQLMASGGLATVAGALLSVPALVAFAANAVMSTSYRKTIPATLALLTAHELRRQLADLEASK